MRSHEPRTPHCGMRTPMTLKPLQAFGIALALGGAALVGSATLPLVSTAQAATVRPAVGRPLQAAISLANQGQAGAALAKVREAESVSGLTGSEQAAIAQTRAYIGAKPGAGGSAVGCKAKFANDYNGGRYREVVGEDADCLRKSGGYGYSDEIIVAQAYYLMGDYNTAIRMLRGMGDSDQVLSLLMSAAGKAGDTQTEGAVAERLILKGQSKYWTYLLPPADHTPRAPPPHPPPRPHSSRESRHLSGALRHRQHAQQRGLRADDAARHPAGLLPGGPGRGAEGLRREAAAGRARHPPAQSRQDAGRQGQRQSRQPAEAGGEGEER